MKKAKEVEIYMGTGFPLQRLAVPTVRGGEEVAIPTMHGGKWWYVYKAPPEGIPAQLISEPANCGGKFLRQERLGPPKRLPMIKF